MGVSPITREYQARRIRSASMGQTRKAPNDMDDTKARIGKAPQAKAVNGFSTGGLNGSGKIKPGFAYTRTPLLSFLIFTQPSSSRTGVNGLSCKTPQRTLTAFNVAGLTKPQ